MRQRDELPLDPEIAAQLDAIDATLAGDPVDPAFAEIAELALLVRAERPAVRPGFAAELDERAARRFAPASSSGATSGLRARARSRLWPAAGALATALTAAIVAVVVLSSGHASRPRPLDGLVKAPQNVAASTTATSTTATSSSAASAPAAGALTPNAAAAPAATTPSAKTASPPATATFGPAASSVQPHQNGRKTVQSAQLALTVAPARIDAVAQEAFDAIGTENGIVEHSNVTSGTGGYADIQLSVPNANLGETMTRLSSLRFATVSQRTDISQDVNDQYVNDVRALRDARALRTSLLKQLAAAVTQQQIDSLNARIHDAEATIAGDERTLDSLNKKVNLSQIDLTINSGPVPVPLGTSSGGGFTLHRAVHDAGRVLVVVAGVALIALAVLVPLALLVALAAWIAATLRRRGREQALDAT
jgi:hypothetical protein